MNKELLPNREIHLDFHTSECIPGIGSRFDPEEFARSFKEAGVTGVCLFTRGHHGWCYYPTRIGKQHPHQTHPDLLGAQIEALKKEGIVPSLYTTVCWDELQAAEHPEWLCRRADGTVMKMFSLDGRKLNPFEAGWHFVCWNSPYRDYVRDQSIEAVSLYEGAYLFIDILFTDEPCCCPHCIARMKKEGLDPADPEDREKNSLDSAREFMQFINEGVHKAVPGLPTFYNSRLRLTGDAASGSRPEMDDMGIAIIESLPSGPWGYDHFNLFARYFQNFPHRTMGHTGKFQKMWGDFGGLKNEAALDYEVVRMMALGVVASIGDQLPPTGKLDKATYELIGKTYSKVACLEEKLLPSRPIDEIGVLLTQEEIRIEKQGLPCETGALKMLMQLQYQFSILDEDSDFSPYKVLILPDEIRVEDKLKNKLDSYLAGGGKLLLSAESGRDGQGNWNIDALPLSSVEEHSYNPFYIYPGRELIEKSIIQDTDHISYLGGMNIKCGKNCEVLATITDPYFNREWDHFCSHLQTPPAERTDTPAMIFNGSNVVYLAARTFRSYNTYSSIADRKLVDYGLRKLLGKSKLIESNLPSTAEATLRCSEEGDTVLTLMHYIPQRRTAEIDIIEDTIPLHNAEISLLLDKKYRNAVDLRTGTEYAIDYKNGRNNFVIPVINGFTALVFNT